MSNVVQLNPFDRMSTPPGELSIADLEGVYTSVAGTLRRGRRQIAAENHTAYNDAATLFRDLRHQLQAEVNAARSETLLLSIDSETAHEKQAMGVLMAVIAASEVNPREDVLVAVMKDAEVEYVKSKMGMQYRDRDFLALMLTRSYVYFFEVKYLVFAALAHDSTCLDDCPLILRIFYSDEVPASIAPLLNIVENELMLYRDRVDDEAGGTIRNAVWIDEDDKHLKFFASQCLGQVPNPWVVIASNIASTTTSTGSIRLVCPSASVCQRRYEKLMNSSVMNKNTGEVIKRTPWSAADDAEYKVLVEKYYKTVANPWECISKELTIMRTQAACEKHYHTMRVKGVVFNFNSGWFQLSQHETTPVISELEKRIAGDDEGNLLLPATAPVSQALGYKLQVPWSFDDDVEFKRVVEKYLKTGPARSQPWDKIAGELSTKRTAGACNQHYNTMRGRGVTFVVTRDDGREVMVGSPFASPSSPPQQKYVVAASDGVATSSASSSPLAAYSGVATPNVLPARANGGSFRKRNVREEAEVEAEEEQIVDQGLGNIGIVYSKDKKGQGQKTVNVTPQYYQQAHKQQCTDSDTKGVRSIPFEE